jgi:hypothetical protein
MFGGGNKNNNNSNSGSTPAYDMNLVNDEYETKMIGYEAGCADGTGDPGACHHVGE